MLFDNLFGMMTPALTLGLLAGIIVFFAGLTWGYVRYERSSRRCLNTREIGHV